MKVVSVHEMKDIEDRSAQEDVSEDTLMKAAGLSIARRIALVLDGIRGRKVLFLIGPGNNGGDGLVAARHLANWGCIVTLYMATSKRRLDKLDECRDGKVRVLEGSKDPEHWILSSYLSTTDIVVDAILGIGSNRPLASPILELFNSLKISRQLNPYKLIAIDVPTGINADFGTVDDACCPTDVTFALGAPKIGLFRSPGIEYRGKLEILDIGLPQEVTDHINLDLAEHLSVAQILPKRPLIGHKGTFGHLLVIAGSRNFVGAAILASTAAYRAGSGLVTLASPENVYRIVASASIETTHLPLPESADGTISPDAGLIVHEAFKKSSAVVLGPGLGGTESVQKFVQNCLFANPAPSVPFVIDADALNSLARTYQWAEHIAGPAVLTPHPGEMSRLTRIPVKQIESNRLEAARESAKRWNQVVVLKGAHTIVASPDGRTTISPYANPALASGGTGDVLTGIIGSMLSQGLDTYTAAVAGVHIHGEAGERVRDDIGNAGLLATDLLSQIPRAIRQIINSRE